ncbi:MAG: hypothetical protein JXR07_17160 [Reichenbachiella sp.]
MKHIAHIFILLWMCFACQEYTSHYPISEPSQSTIKSPVSGDWQFVSSIKLANNERVGYGDHFMRITPFNKQEYLVQLISDSLTSMKDVNHFRGFTTTIDKCSFANISPVDNEGKRPVFSIYKYDLKGDSLIFRGISQETFESLNTYVNSVGQHKKFIKSAISQKDLWDVEYKYVRKR